MQKIWYFWVLVIALVLVGCDTVPDTLIGANAPQFTLSDADSSEVSLSNYSGQPILLYFHMAVG